MPTSYTSLLGLALPTTGELSGTWGTTVNDAITSLLDSAVAGTTTLSTDADVTLTTTDGAANQARSAVLLCSGARTAIRTLTAPAKSKGYVIINATTGGYDVKIVGVGPTTGVLVPAGTRVFVVWNGSDFVRVASSTVAASDITGVLATANGGTNLSSFTTNGAMYATSTSALTTGTLPVESGGTGAATLTANNVLLGNGTSAVQFVAPGTTGNVLTSTGSTWTSSALASGPANFTRSAKTGAYTLLTGDKGYWIDCTSGTFTLSFTAAATLTNGWWCRISNSGSGNITLDPNGSETIDGLTSYIMYPGEIRDVFCDGTGFNTVLVKPFRIFLTASSTTLTMPPGYSELGFDLQGGGAGGGGGGSFSSGADGGYGGGGGGRHVGATDAPSANTSITVAVGAGGTGAAGRAGNTGATRVNGNAGGASSLAWGGITYITAGGGGGAGGSLFYYGGGLYPNDTGSTAKGWGGSTNITAPAEYGGGVGSYTSSNGGGCSMMGAPGGGSGGSTASTTGTAGGIKRSDSTTGGGGGAGGTASNNGGTAADSGGGGGGGTSGAGSAGNGGAGTGYGSGGGGGGASAGGQGGNGGAGAAGYACVWGIA